MGDFGDWLVLMLLAVLGAGVVSAVVIAMSERRKPLRAFHDRGCWLCGAASAKPHVIEFGWYAKSVAEDSVNKYVHRRYRRIGDVPVFLCDACIDKEHARRALRRVKWSLIAGGVCLPIFVVGLARTDLAAPMDLAGLVTLAAGLVVLVAACVVAFAGVERLFKGFAAYNKTTFVDEWAWALAEPRIQASHRASDPKQIFGDRAGAANTYWIDRRTADVDAWERSTVRPSS